MFYQCSALEEINFENIVGAIGDYAFYGCEKIKTLAIPKVTAIGNSSFGNCYGLESIVAEKVISVGDYAFASSKESSTLSTKLVTLELPLVETIGESAFRGSGRLETVNLPALKSMGEGVFYNCVELTTVAFSAELKELPAYAFYNCEKLVFDFSGIERIGAGAFYLVNLPENLVLNDVLYIDDHAFVENTKHFLVSLTAPKLTHIGMQAFYNCTNLTSVSIPAVEYIGDNAFASTAMKEFEVGESLQEFGAGVFEGCDTFEAFFATVDGEKVYDAELDHVMISGGVLYTKWAKGYTLVCYPTAKADTEYTVAENTIRLEFGCAKENSKLEKIILPRTLEYIADYAFYGCDNLKTVVFNSYYAPVIEGSLYGETLNITHANKDNYPGFDILYRYSYEYMLDGRIDYPIYYRNFKGDIGSSEATDLTAVLPQNCEGYDAMVFRAFFAVSEENSGVTAGPYAVAFMEAVFKLPDSIDRFDRLLMEAAIGAYNALQGHSEELEFVDNAYLEKFFKARSAYNVDVVTALIAHLFDMDATKYSFEKVKEAHDAYHALTEEEKALVVGADTLQTKIKELSVAIGRDIDFSLTYEEHFPEKQPDETDPIDPEPESNFSG